MTKHIKICDGFRVHTIDGVEEFKAFSDLLKAFKWDTESDLAAKEAAGELMRWLYALGRVDLTEACGGRWCVVTAIPCWEEVDE